MHTRLIDKLFQLLLTCTYLQYKIGPTTCIEIYISYQFSVYFDLLYRCMTSNRIGIDLVLSKRFMFELFHYAHGEWINHYGKEWINNYLTSELLIKSGDK